jgi:hypothetical protein
MHRLLVVVAAVMLVALLAASVAMVVARAVVRLVVVTELVLGLEMEAGMVVAVAALPTVINHAYLSLMSRAIRVLGWTVALLTLFAGATYLFYVWRSASSIQNPLTPDLQQLVQLKQHGSDNSAFALYQQINADPTKAPGEKATAAIYAAGTPFILSGDVGSRIQEIQQMKSIVLNTALSADVRAAAMSVLGNEYSLSGRDPVVFTEIYKDAPFSSYLESGNPDLSAMNLEEASYEISPSSFAAIKVAVLALMQYLDNPKQATSTTAAYVKLAEEYLYKADAVATQEARRSPTTYMKSDRYMLYRFARVSAFGLLAIQKGEPYKSRYRTEFNMFITFAQSQNSTLARDEILSARFEHARILAAEGDFAGEKIQLDLLASALRELPNPKMNILALSFINAHMHESTGARWSAIQQMMSISPDFQAVVAAIVSL